MRDSFIPEFRVPLELQSNQLSLDLVSVTISGLRIVGTHMHGEIAFSNLARMSISDRSGRRVSLFNAPKNTRPGVDGEILRPAQISIKKEATTIGSAKIVPVLTGRLRTRRGRYIPANVNQGHMEYTDVTVQLEFNLSRFLSAQTYTRRADGRVEMNWPNVFAVEKRTPRRGDEVAFGSDGNLVIGSDMVYEYAATVPAERQLMRAIDAFTGAIVEELRNGSQSSNTIVEFNPEFTLRRVEWYAEFSARDPRRELNRIMPILSQTGMKGNVFRRRLTAKVFMHNPHSLAYQTQLRVGVRQTTYSKSNRRLRFEVKYAPRGISNVAGRRTGFTEEGIRRTLLELRQHSSTELGRLLSTINSVREAVQECPFTRDELVMFIAAYSTHMVFAEEIITSLRDSGRVIVEPGSQLRPSLDNMPRRPAIFRFVRRSVYTVTDDFQCALMDLMSQEDGAQAEMARSMIE